MHHSLNLQCISQEPGHKYVENYHLGSLQVVHESGISDVMEREPTDSHVLAKYPTTERYPNPESDVSVYLFSIYDQRYKTNTL